MTDLQEHSQEKEKETPQSSTERVEVVSGLLLVMDQFMLSNPDFLQAIPKTFEPDEEEFFTTLADQAEEFGGFILEISPGSYTVFRNTYTRTMAVFPEFDGATLDESRFDEIAENGESVGSVLIDTRCVVIFDAALCYRERLISEYRKLRRENDDKAARDMIRENGASVRYGFSRRSEELEAFFDEGSEILVLRGVE
ncbi:MAG TPA: hypothetical protein PKA63_05830 [Oligoflexia bacterium]|nr:hypothetical protein [Oligoflexia bacterium]HMP48169.1 hypothetical protein [Oligoflexia bacterium]